MFLESFRLALPGLEEDSAARGFQFMLGKIYSSVTGIRRIECLTDGKSCAQDYKAYYDLLIPYVSAGFTLLTDKSQKND